MTKQHTPQTSYWHPDGMRIGDGGHFVEVSEYRKLLAQRDALLEAMKKIASNKRDDEAESYADVVNYYNSEDAYSDGAKNGRDEMAEIARSAIADCERSDG